MCSRVSMHELAQPLQRQPPLGAVKFFPGKACEMPSQPPGYALVHMFQHMHALATQYYVEYYVLCRVYQVDDIHKLSCMKHLIAYQSG